MGRNSSLSGSWLRPSSRIGSHVPIHRLRPLGKKASRFDPYGPAITSTSGSAGHHHRNIGNPRRDRPVYIENGTGRVHLFSAAPIGIVPCQCSRGTRQTDHRRTTCSQLADASRNPGDIHSRADHCGAARIRFDFISIFIFRPLDLKATAKPRELPKHPERPVTPFRRRPRGGAHMYWFTASSRWRRTQGPGMGFQAEKESRNCIS